MISLLAVRKHEATRVRRAMSKLSRRRAHSRRARTMVAKISRLHVGERATLSGSRFERLVVLPTGSPWRLAVCVQMYA